MTPLSFHVQGNLSDFFSGLENIQPVFAETDVLEDHLAFVVN
jgi:hypothetical protein